MSEIKDTTVSVTEAMRDKSTAVVVETGYHPARGQAYVTVDQEKRLIIMPKDDEKAHHIGKIVALGLPPFHGRYAGAPEVPWEVEVGDEVIFVYAVWLDMMRIVNMPNIGRVAVIAYEEILCVVDRAPSERTTDPALPFALDEPEDPARIPVEPDAP